MNAPTLTDRLRALAQDPALADALANDPALQERARAFAAVFAATRVLDEAVPASTTDFDALWARAEHERRARWLRRAAAAVFVLATAAWVVVRGLEPRDGAVVLECLPLAPRATSEPEPLPAVLADYAPVTGGQVQFLASLDDARAVSAVVGRPVLVFGYVEGCPWCVELRGKQFLDPRFQELAARTVPVAIDLLALGADLSAPFFERGYPVIELQDAHGATELVLSGPPGTVDLVHGLERGLERAPHGPPALAWTAANDLARKLVTSSSEERQGRYSIAWRGFAELAAAQDAPAFAEHGRAGLARLANEARAALGDALERSRVDVPAACAELEELASRCTGTPMEPDVRRVLTALDATRQPPQLRARSE
ncbi:MAG: hypothetical protein IPJ77_22400 [Planctomycetes bacterium]|nr:hypothetical protein [Planctomycetota bacterium]